MSTHSAREAEFELETKSEPEAELRCVRIDCRKNPRTLRKLYELDTWITNDGVAPVETKDCAGRGIELKYCPHIHCELRGSNPFKAEGVLWIRAVTVQEAWNLSST